MDHPFEKMNQTVQGIGSVGTTIAAFLVIYNQLDWPTPFRILVFTAPTIGWLFFGVWPALRSKRRDQEIANLAGATKAIKPRYFRITPYTESAEDIKAYSRPDGFQNTLFRWFRNPDPLCYLTGMSGSGKTSLIHAALLPQLKSEGWKTLVVRSFQNPLNEIKKAMDLKGKTTEALNDLLRRKRSKTLIVLDQFEEFLILEEEHQEAIEAFKAWIHDYLKEPGRNIKILMVFRSDYEGLLTSFDLPPIRDSNYLVVPPFRIREAKAFLGDSGDGFTEKTLGRAIKEAEVIEGNRGIARPITLNMIGLALKEIGHHHKGKALIPAFIRNKIIGLNLGPKANELLDSMITSHGTKVPKTPAQLSEGLKMPESLIRGHLISLSNAGLVRSLDENQDEWEIAHDYVARAMSRVLATWKTALIEKLRPWITYSLTACLLTWVLASIIFYQDPLKQLASFGVITTSLQKGIFRTEFPLSQTQFESVFSLLKNRKTKIKEIDLRDSSTIINLRPLIGMEALTNLNLAGCHNIKDLKPVGTLTALTTLNLQSCSDVTDLKPLSTLTALTTLNLAGCVNITDISPLSSLTALTTLDLRNCYKVTDLKPLGVLSALTTLDLVGWYSLNDLNPLSTLGALTTLNLAECSQIADLEPLGSLEALTTLTLVGCSQITDLEPLGTLTALTTLTLGNTSNITDLEPLGTLPALTTLTLYDCPRITDLEPLGTLPALTTLSLSNCVNITDFQPLSALQSLTALELDRCKITDLKFLSQLTTLTILELTNCNSITNIKPLGTLTALTSLSLDNSQQINDFTPLGTLTALTNLNLRYTNITDLKPLETLTVLTKLNLLGCIGIKNFDPVSHVKTVLK